MQPEIKVTETFSDLAAISRALRALTEQDVFIGIPEDESGRESTGGITNAHLGYIHEFGVPEKNIPARPHLLPGIEDIQRDAIDLLEDAAREAMNGNEKAVATNLNKIGVLGQNAVRARFVNNEWPPLADRTLDYKPLKKNDEGEVITDKKGNPKRKKSRREKERVNPLIDTGQLRKAYTYVVRKKGNTALVVK